MNLEEIMLEIIKKYPNFVKTEVKNSSCKVPDYHSGFMENLRRSIVSVIKEHEYKEE